MLSGRVPQHQDPPSPQRGPAVTPPHLGGPKAADTPAAAPAPENEVPLPQVSAKVLEDLGQDNRVHPLSPGLRCHFSSRPREGAQSRREGRGGGGPGWGRGQVRGRGRNGGEEEERGKEPEGGRWGGREKGEESGMGSATGVGWHDWEQGLGQPPCPQRPERRCPCSSDHTAVCAGRTSRHL